MRRSCHFGKRNQRSKSKLSLGQSLRSPPANRPGWKLIITRPICWRIGSAAAIIRRANAANCPKRIDVRRRIFIYRQTGDLRSRSVAWSGDHATAWRGLCHSALLQPAACAARLGGAPVSPSFQNLLHHPCRFDAGEAHVEALVAVGEAGVVDAERVKHGGVQVADVDGVLNGAVA